MSFEFPKPAAATQDYTVDWTPWLAPVNDQIASVVFTIAPARAQPATGDCSIAPTAPPFQGGFCSCWISGGVRGTLYLVTCVITTVGTGGAPRTSTAWGLLMIS